MYNDNNPANVTLSTSISFAKNMTISDTFKIVELGQKRLQFLSVVEDFKSHTLVLLSLFAVLSCTMSKNYKTVILCF